MTAAPHSDFQDVPSWQSIERQYFLEGRVLPWHVVPGIRKESAVNLLEKLAGKLRNRDAFVPVVPHWVVFPPLTIRSLPIACYRRGRQNSRTSKAGWELTF